MGLLATLLENLIGPWFRWTILPLMLAGLFWMGGKLIEHRDEQLRREGEMACLQKWELANLQAERDAAFAQARQAAEEARAERTVRERLRKDNEALEMQLQEVRAAIRDTEQRCLSDRVRELVLGDQG